MNTTIDLSRVATAVLDIGGQHSASEQAQGIRLSVGPNTVAQAVGVRCEPTVASLLRLDTDRGSV